MLSERLLPEFGRKTSNCQDIPGAQRDYSVNSFNKFWDYFMTKVHNFILNSKFGSYLDWKLETTKSYSVYCQVPPLMKNGSLYIIKFVCFILLMMAYDLPTKQSCLCYYKLLL